MVIVDEATGREKDRTRWQDGIHPATEAKHEMEPGPDHSSLVGRRRCTSH